MRYETLFILMLLVAALPSGCNSPDGTSAIAAQRDKAKTETTEALQASADYVNAEKVVFVEKMKKELVAIQKDLNRLSAKIDQSSGAAKADAKIKVKELQEKWAQAKLRLDQAESASASTWNDVKVGFKQSYDDLKDSFDKTRQWLSDKIEA